MRHEGSAYLQEEEIHFVEVVEVVEVGIIFRKYFCCCCGWKDFDDDWQVCQLKYSPQVARIWEFFLNKKKNTQALMKKKIMYFQKIK